ncbi:MAG TPA: acyl-CoA dehydrogenase family protein [Caldilineaceae bacterium]|nr:acyl-CoA dehydrogenase family protein [Caldilineaceae bacterium]
MYSFDMSAEQKMLVETVHRFAEQKLRPAFREAEECKAIPPAVVKHGGELGVLPASIDAQYGGFGDYSLLTAVLYLEELAWGDVGISLHLLTPNLAAIPLALLGTPAQKERYLPRFCADKFPRATAALVEPVIQFDPAGLATTAEKSGDGYVLNGKKTLVPLASEAELFLIYAREGGLTQAFLVEGNTPGLRIGEAVRMMGAQALATYQITLEGVKVAQEQRLGERRGIRLNRLLTVSRIALAALAVGQARAAYEYALAYAKERVAFGEPIAQRQSIAFMLANMRIEIEGARLMTWDAAYQLDAGEDAGKAAALAKQYADKMVLEVTDGAVQVLGGHGYVRDHPVELWLRNGRGFATWDGLVMA